MARLTRKQRLKLKREREAAQKAFERRGDIRRAERAARDERSAQAGSRPETPRERHLREQREREEARVAARRAEYGCTDAKEWAMANASVGRADDLCSKLRKAGIPHFRAQDEVKQVSPSGRVRKLRVPLVARTVFVGVETEAHLARLQEAFPWLTERVPGQRYGRPKHSQHPSAQPARLDVVRVGDRVEALPGEAFPWHVDRYERTGSQDAAGAAVFKPALIPNEQMQPFTETLIGAQPLLDMDQPFSVGEAVRVADGPYASFPGTIEEVDLGRSALKVAVSIFGRATPVELGFTQVERM